MQLVTLGVGAQASPLYAPAGLLVTHRGLRVMIDGGPGAEPGGQGVSPDYGKKSFHSRITPPRPPRLDAWLVCDERSELQPELRRLARERGLVPQVARFEGPGLRITPHAVVHTNHPTFGYLIETEHAKVVWAPEFFRFPRWAKGASLMFAEGAGWDRPIRFRGGVGGHLPVLAVAEAARRAGVQRLVFAHLGRPTLRAMAAGLRPPFGEFARDGQRFRLPRVQPT